jgi:hypothetical protein
MNRAIVQQALLVPVILSLGCGAPRPEWTETGIRHEEFRYAVGFADRESETFLGEEWRVDNWYMWTEPSGRQKKTLKRGPVYETKETWDRTGDGIADETRLMNRHDLLLCHRKDDGRIWVKVWELDRSRQEQDLAVILESIVSGLSGEFEVSIGTVQRLSEGKSYAAETTWTRRARLGPHAALLAEVTVADLDRLQLSPGARHRTLRLLISRIPIAPQSPAQDRSRWPRVEGSNSGLLVVGYSNSPDRFEEHLGDFERFLGLIEFPQEGGETGFEWIDGEPPHVSGTARPSPPAAAEPLEPEAETEPAPETSRSDQTDAGPTPAE